MIFAFGHSEDTYFIGNGKRSFWTGVPNSLATYLRKNHPLRALSFGEESWFYSEAPHDGTNGIHSLAPDTPHRYPDVQDIFDSGEPINWIAFGPDGQYVVDTKDKIYHSNPGAVRRKRGGAQIPLRCASFGWNGSWIYVDEDGTVRSGGLAGTIKSALKTKAIRNVQLSPHSSSAYYIEYVDGEVAWSLPSAWHGDTQRIEKIDVRIDQPGTPGRQSVSQRIHFAFGHTIDVFCISNGQDTMGMGLEPEFRGWSIKGVPKRAISLGENGAYFMRQGPETFLSSATQMAYPEVWRIYNSDQKIIWVAFGPQGYYIVETESRTYASRSDVLLRNYESGGLQVPLRCASFGYGGSWVVVEDDGVIRSSGLTKRVLEKLKVDSVRNVQLSITHPSQFYIEYMNGTRDWIIPENWANGVNTVEGSLPKRPTVSNNYKATVVPQYLRLIPAGSIFNSISYQFSTSWRHTDRPRPLVRYIYKILSVNRASENAHRAYADRIENEQRLWHATVRRCQLGDDGQGLQLCADEQCSLCQIIRTSFKKKFSLDSGMFGKGIYVSSTSSKAAGYSQNSQPSNYKAILLNNVVVGRAYETNEPMQGRTAPPAGYDSVCGLPGTALKFDETCVYDDDAIRPTYLILYDVGKP